jgi:hypothetical protein
MNELLSRGEIDREDMWPRIAEYEAKAAPFLFELGLDRLPTEPGLVVVRGPRQYGKSTSEDSSTLVGIGLDCVRALDLGAARCKVVYPASMRTAERSVRQSISLPPRCTAGAGGGAQECEHQQLPSQACIV